MRERHVGGLEEAVGSNIPIAMQGGGNCVGNNEAVAAANTGCYIRLSYALDARTIGITR